MAGPRHGTLSGARCWWLLLLLAAIAAEADRRVVQPGVCLMQKGTISGKTILAGTGEQPPPLTAVGRRCGPECPGSCADGVCLMPDEVLATLVATDARQADAADGTPEAGGGPAWASEEAAWAALGAPLGGQEPPREPPPAPPHAVPAAMLATGARALGGRSAEAGALRVAGAEAAAEVALAREASEHTRLRDELSRWHQAGLEMLVNEARAVQLLEERAATRPGPPLAGVSDSAALMSMQAVVAGNQTDKGAGEVLVQLLPAGITRQLHFVKKPHHVGYAVAFLAVVAAMTFAVRSFANRAKSSIYGASDMASKAATGQRPVSARSHGGLASTLLGMLGPSSAFVEIAEIQLGHFDESSDCSVLRVVVTPASGKSVRTRTGVPMDGDGGSIYLSFADIIIIPADSCDGPVVFSVYGSDALMDEDRLARVEVSVQTLLSMARERREYFTLDLEPEGWCFRRDAAHRPFLAMRICEVTAAAARETYRQPSLERRNTGLPR